MYAVHPRHVEIATWNQWAAATATAARPIHLVFACSVLLTLFFCSSLRRVSASVFVCHSFGMCAQCVGCRAFKRFDFHFVYDWSLHKTTHKMNLWHPDTSMWTVCESRHCPYVSAGMRNAPMASNFFFSPVYVSVSRRVCVVCECTLRCVHHRKMYLVLPCTPWTSDQNQQKTNKALKFPQRFSNNLFRSHVEYIFFILSLARRLDVPIADGAMTVTTASVVSQNVKMRSTETNVFHAKFE